MDVQSPKELGSLLNEHRERYGSMESDDGTKSPTSTEQEKTDILFGRKNPPWYLLSILCL